MGSCGACGARCIRVRDGTMVRVVYGAVCEEVINPNAGRVTVFGGLVTAEDASEPAGEQWPWVSFVQEVYEVFVQAVKEGFIVAASSIET